MKTIWHESYFWLYTSHLQAVNFIGCLKKLKFRLFGIHWRQPRKKKEERGKRKEKVNLKERRRSPVKKIWSLREERPCAMSLRNCEWCRWVERWESENVFFFFFPSSFSCFGSICIYRPKQPDFAGMVGIFSDTKQKGYLYRFAGRYGIYWLYWPVRYEINFLRKRTFWLP